MFKQLHRAYATQKKKFHVSKQKHTSLLISTTDQAELLLKLMYSPKIRDLPAFPKVLSINENLYKCYVFPTKLRQASHRKYPRYIKTVLKWVDISDFKKTKKEIIEKEE